MKKIINFLAHKGSYVLGLALASLVGGLVSAAVLAAIPDGSGIIHSCYKNNTGSLKVIDSSSATCSSGETSLNWNQKPGNNGLPFTCGGCQFGGDDTVFLGKDLSNSYFNHSDLTTTNLTGTNFTNATFKGTTFSQANLTNTNFTNTNSTSVGFDQTTINATNFSGANFNNVDFRFTDASSANFTGATWVNVLCPDGTNSDDNGLTCLGHLVP